MNFTVKIWRQHDRTAAGRLAEYKVADVSPDMSFLEMIDKPNVELAYTDTDSLVYNITYGDKQGDAYADMFALKEHFDMSGYGKVMPSILDMTNAKVVGKMKDETSDDVITEFIALRPKAYAFTTREGVLKMKAKG